MEKVIHENQLLEEIVSIFPGVSDIFNKYKVDFCCGGHDQAAVEEKGLTIGKIVDELISLLS